MSKALCVPLKMSTEPYARKVIFLDGDASEFCDSINRMLPPGFRARVFDPINFGRNDPSRLIIEAFSENNFIECSHLVNETKYSFIIVIARQTHYFGLTIEETAYNYTLRSETHNMRISRQSMTNGFF